MASFSTDRFIEQFLAVQGQVYGYIATLVPNRVDADDLFQQTALVLWRKHRQFDPSREFLPWTLGIAHNEVRRFFRSHSCRGTHLSDAMMERLAELHYASVSRTAPRFQRLAECMAQLTADQRGLIEQCYLGVDSIKADCGETAPRSSHTLQATRSNSLDFDGLYRGRRTPGGAAMNLPPVQSAHSDELTA